MKIQHVPIEFVNQTWPFAEGFIVAAIKNQGGEPEVTIEQIKLYVTSGQWLLVVGVGDDAKIRGAACMHFFNRPDNRVAFVTHIGGRLIANNDTFDQLRALCKSFGATKIEGAVTEAIARLWKRFGFTEKYTIAEVSI